MARASDFIRNLSALAGVGGYLLTHSNGNVISHNLSDPDVYGSWARQMVQQCAPLSVSLNNEGFKGVSMQQEGGFIHIFPIRQYQLVVIQGDAANEQLFHQIEVLIQDTVERG